MNVQASAIPDVKIIEPRVFSDARGAFFESFSAERYAQVGIRGPFVQDNVSQSARGVLRGLHFQHPRGQAKLLSVLQGEVFDVVVDVRRGSPAFANWVGVRLSAENKRQLYVPAGFAHGFLVLADAVVSYKCSEYYDAASEHALRWDDPRIGVEWPMTNVTMSDKDRAARTLAELEDKLPRYGGKAV